MRQLSTLLAGLVTAGAAALPLATPTPAVAASASAARGGGVATAYVSPHGSPGKRGRSCATARFRSINQAIASVPAGGTVVVCHGTYHQQAVVRKPLALIGRAAVINAKGQKPVIPHLPGGSGIVVLHTRHVKVTGFTVRGAGFDGILVARSHHVLVSRNLLEHNGNVGVDFNGSHDSLATRNVSQFNTGGGFLIADDLGRTYGNAVTWNIARHNPGGCGVIIAGHSTSGVWGNLVAHNSITFNGLSHKAPGAGVVIATEVKHERVSGNEVMGNYIVGNGLSGVTIHSHLPHQDLNGNMIVGNDIGTNNLRGDPIGLAPPVTAHPDRYTTGILVGSSSVIRVVIRGNLIHDNRYGIYLNGRIRAHIHGNSFHRVQVPIKVA
jgi:nitrous oxidase accessory protein NosD